MTETKLKPCPFCGSKEHIYTVCKMYAVENSKYISFDAWCECNICYTKGWAIEATYETKDLKEDDVLTEMYEGAKQAWNSRMNNDE